MDLKTGGYSVTSERKQIFNLLEKSSPVAIIEIEKNLPDINRSTIYRNIELFEKLGFVKRVYIGWKYKIELSDKYSSHHHHITCTNCRSVQAIKSDDLIENEISKLSSLYNYRHVSHQLEIQGLCKNCC